VDAFHALGDYGYRELIRKFHQLADRGAIHRLFHILDQRFIEFDEFGSEFADHLQRIWTGSHVIQRKTEALRAEIVTDFPQVSAVANQIGFHDFENEIVPVHARFRQGLDGAAHAEFGIVNRRRHEIDEKTSVPVLPGRVQHGEPARISVERVDLFANLSGLHDFPAGIEPFRLQADQTFVRHHLAGRRIHDRLIPGFEAVAG